VRERPRGGNAFEAAVDRIGLAAADHDRKVPLPVHLAQDDDLLILHFADDNFVEFHLNRHRRYSISRRAGAALRENEAAGVVTQYEGFEIPVKVIGRAVQGAAIRVYCISRTRVNISAMVSANPSTRQAVEQRYERYRVSVEQYIRFRQDGFLVVKNLIAPKTSRSFACTPKISCTDGCPSNRKDT
jgi:hypothetical protein